MEVIVFVDQCAIHTAHFRLHYRNTLYRYKEEVDLRVAADPEETTEEGVELSVTADREEVELSVTADPEEVELSVTTIDLRVTTEELRADQQVWIGRTQRS